MTTKFGLIGMSPGNGHPYSWSAICNGYDQKLMAKSGFPIVSQYLAQRSWPDDRLPGVEVTHVWTQDPSLSAKIARATFIKTVVERPSDMIGQVDGVLLARDDAENHLEHAEPFLEAGVPIYIDKPIALTETQFDLLHSKETRSGQIFSCSALRYASELRLDPAKSEVIGPIKYIQGITPGPWNTYAVHLIDPLLSMVDSYSNPVKKCTANLGRNGAFVAVQWPDGGPDVHLAALGTGVPAPISFRVFGERSDIVLRFQDSFSAFREALREFHGIVIGRGHNASQTLNRQVVRLLEFGRP